jgi:thiol-disulfide isomerase/thioredoxin
MPSTAWWIFPLALISTGCALANQPDQLVAAQSAPDIAASDASHASNLPGLGSAPELENTIWLNVDPPLRLSALRGKVVLLDMWTLGCINCQHIIPTLRALHVKYFGQGLVIIANRCPEFAYEQGLENLKAAVEAYAIPYAVAQDNGSQTWQAYHNRYWPTLYLIDNLGHIRHVHIGEGAYQETEDAVQALLDEPA